MPVKQPKKLLIMNILDILRKYSDEEHRLSQKDIAEILKTEYDMDRRPQSHPAEHSEPHGLRLQHRVQRVHPYGAEPQNRPAGGELPVVRLLSGAGLHRRRTAAAH